MVESISKITNAITSRFQLLCFPRYSISEIKIHLNNFLNELKFTLPEEKVDSIVLKSDRNIEFACLMLLNQTQGDFGKPIWEEISEKIIQRISTEEISPAIYISIKKNLLDELLSQSVSPNLIFITLMEKVMNSSALKSDQKYEIAKIGYIYDLKFSKSSFKYSLVLIEQFLVQIIPLLKKSS